MAYSYKSVAKDVYRSFRDLIMIFVPYSDKTPPRPIPSLFYRAAVNGSS